MNIVYKKISFLLLAGLVTMAAGCTEPQKKRLPNSEIANPRSSAYPNVNLPQGGALGVPGAPGAAPRYVSPNPKIQAPQITRLEDSLADDARTVKGVNDASVLLIGRTALVGIDIGKDMQGNNVKKIKNQVIKQLKTHPQVKTAIVSSDPDLLERIQDILEGRSTPDTIGDLYQRMKMER